MLKLAILGALAVATMSSTPAPTSAQDSATYAVIVNPKNKCSQTGDKLKGTIKKLYLKQLSQWPDGTAARPYGRKSSKPEQGAFVQDVLDMGDAELARHWLKMKNMKGTTPPKGVRSDRMILKYVAKHDGAFGVVKISDAEKDNSVKILYRF